MFSPDATAELLGRESVGRVAIVDRIRSSLAPFVATQHIVSNHHVNVAGDSATCRCYLQAQHVRKDTDGGETFTIGGYYEDELTRTADGWRIVRRTLVATWTEGNPAGTGKN